MLDLLPQPHSRPVIYRLVCVTINLELRTVVGRKHRLDEIRHRMIPKVPGDEADTQATVRLRDILVRCRGPRERVSEQRTEAPVFREDALPILPGQIIEREKQVAERVGIRRLQFDRLMKQREGFFRASQFVQR